MRWATIYENKKKEVLPERIAAICFRKNKENLYEFLLVRSSDENQNRRGFPKKPLYKNDNRDPIDVAIEVAEEEGAVKVIRVEKAPVFQPFNYKKEGSSDIVKYTPYLLEVERRIKDSPVYKLRDPKFFPLGEVFTELRKNRSDNESKNSLERVICQCYEFLLRQ